MRVKSDFWLNCEFGTLLGLSRSGIGMAGLGAWDAVKAAPRAAHHALASAISSGPNIMLVGIDLIPERDISGIRLGMTPTEVVQALTGKGYTRTNTQNRSSYTRRLADALHERDPVRFPQRSYSDKEVTPSSWFYGGPNGETLGVGFIATPRGPVVAHVRFNIDTTRSNLNDFYNRVVAKYGPSDPLPPIFQNKGYFAWCPKTVRPCDPTGYDDGRYYAVLEESKPINILELKAETLLIRVRDQQLKADVDAQAPRNFLNSEFYRTSLMAIILILVALGAIVGAFTGMRKFNEHCLAKFDHAFFTKSSFLITTIAYLALSGDISWYLAAIKAEGELSNPIVLAALGVAGLGYIVWKNIKRTNLSYGIGGTCIQLPLFAVLAYFGVVILAIVAALYILGGVVGGTGNAIEADRRARQRRGW